MSDQDFHIDESAVQRIKSLREAQGKPALMLRVRVEGGGCSGFQYQMDLTDAPDQADIEFADCVLSDKMSLLYLNGATLSFEEALAGSQFKIDNPNAASGCGCGNSFAM